VISGLGLADLYVDNSLARNACMCIYGNILQRILTALPSMHCDMGVYVVVYLVPIVELIIEA
jgi:hypothetical protein